MRYRCFSYAFLGRRADVKTARPNLWNAFRYCVQENIRVFLDSGAFTIQNSLRQRAGIDPLPLVDAYGRFVLRLQEEGVPLDFYVTFDYAKDCRIVRDVTLRLQREFKLKPVVVYHGDASLDWLRRYIGEGHTLICIGRIARLGTEALLAYYHRVFDEASRHKGIRLHGLMVTGQNAFKFPWYSVDSTTWTRLAANNRLLFIDPRRRRVSNFKASPMPAQAAAMVRAAGFSPKQLATSAAERAIFNLLEFEKLASFPREVEWSPTLP